MDIVKTILPVTFIAFTILVGLFAGFNKIKFKEHLLWSFAAIFVARGAFEYVYRLLLLWQLDAKSFITVFIPAVVGLWLMYVLLMHHLKEDYPEALTKSKANLVAIITVVIAVVYKGLFLVGK